MLNSIGEKLEEQRSSTSHCFFWNIRTAKLLFNRLKQLGAIPLIRRGDGDDQHPYGLYGELYGWMDELWKSLLSLYPLPSGVEVLPANVLPPPKFSFKVRENGDVVLPSTSFLRKESERYDGENVYFAPLLSNSPITANECEKDVRHIVLNIRDSNIRFYLSPSSPLNKICFSYSPGDVVYIHPRNFVKETETFIKRILGFDPDLVIEKVEPYEKGGDVPHFNTPITLRNLLLWHYDIFGIPGRYFFELLSFFASDSAEKEKLLYFASREGQGDAWEYSKRAKRNCVDILSDFSSTKVPLEYIFSLFPLLQPRPFSISSAQEETPNEINVSLSVVLYKSMINRKKKGICSTFLAQENVGNLIPIWVSSGTIRLPNDPLVPIIMVGPGTGCAIFRAFLFHRKKCVEKGEKVGKALFFFGCRKEKEDYLYEEEWKSLIECGALTHIIVAFSRDQKKKVYVQHKIKENGAMVWEWMEEGACIYVSGYVLYNLFFSITLDPQTKCHKG